MRSASFVRMRFLSGQLVMGVGATGVMAIAACAALKPIARTAVDVAFAECVAMNPDLDEPALRAACKALEEDFPLLHRLVEARRAGDAKVAARACGNPGK